MCGIVGLYFKKKKLHNQLGKYLSGMLDNMSSRGPDSAGFAIYNNDSKKIFKYSLCIDDKLIAKNFEIDVKKNLKMLISKIYQIISFYKLLLLQELSFHLSKSFMKVF